MNPSKIKLDRLLAMTESLAEFIESEYGHPTLRLRHRRRIAIIQQLVLASNDLIRTYNLHEQHMIANEPSRALLDTAMEYIESCHLLVKAWEKADVKAGMHVVR